MVTGRIYSVFLLLSGWWDAQPHGSSVWLGNNPMWTGTESIPMLSTPLAGKAEGNSTPKMRKGLNSLPVDIVTV